MTTIWKALLALSFTVGAVALYTLPERSTAILSRSEQATLYALLAVYFLADMAWSWSARWR